MWGMKNHEKLTQIAEVARLYYWEGKSQAEIGTLMGVSHSTISRILKEAHELKIVEVLIRQPIQLMSGLSEQLEKRFSLKKAYVVSSGHDVDENLNQLAIQAAQVLSDHLRDGVRLGFSTGSTVAATLQSFKAVQPLHIQVVPLHGIKEDLPGNGSNFLHVLIKQLSRDILTFPAPWLMQSKETSQLILREEAVSTAIHLAESADVGLIGIGGIDEKISEIFRNGWVSEDEYNEIMKAGAVGEICGKFFDQEGKVLDIPFNKRLMAIDLNALRGFETVLAVAGSKNKAKPILAAMQGKLINVLVTDADAARAILDLVKSKD